MAENLSASQLSDLSFIAYSAEKRQVLARIESAAETLITANPGDVTMSYRPLIDLLFVTNAPMTTFEAEVAALEARAAAAKDTASASQ